jgi:hypothetical protein
VHWLYWGDIAALESALSRGLVEWQGVVKNVHYLGMDDNVKRVLGKWWRRWIKTDEGRARNGAGVAKSNGTKTWMDSDEDEDAEDEDEADSVGEKRSAEVEEDHDWGTRHAESAQEVDDGGVSGLLGAL